MEAKNTDFVVAELTTKEKQELAENIKWMQQQRVKQLREQLNDCIQDLNRSQDFQTNDYLRGRIEQINIELGAIQDS